MSVITIEVKQINIYLWSSLYTLTVLLILYSIKIAARRFVKKKVTYSQVCGVHPQ